MRWKQPSALSALAAVLLTCGLSADPAQGPAVTPTRETPISREPAGSRGIWISRRELMARPMAGAAWFNVVRSGDAPCGSPNLADQDDATGVCVLAAALVFARTGSPDARARAAAALDAVASGPRYQGRALSLGRHLVSYVIAADLIDLPALSPSLDDRFRHRIADLLTTPTTGGPKNLIDCHERRPNNWGLHCGASRAAVAAYLGDHRQLARVAQVFKGWLGDRSSYAGFEFGDRAWQCDPEHPVGINPVGCTRAGHSLDGVLPDDQRRSGGFRWPPPHENYVYEALQGAIVQAVILQRAGYDAFAWQDHALLRAYAWLDREAGFPPRGDDTWQIPLVNHFYGAHFSVRGPSNPGKNMGWADWTHGP